MAMHEILFPRWLRALSGEAPQGLYPGGGSRNYCTLGYGADYLAFDSAKLVKPSREGFLSILRDDLEIGHGTSRNDKQGIACEQGAPGAHRTFTLGPILAAYRKALRIGDGEMAALCRSVLLAEVALCRELSWQGHVIMPGARFKDDADRKTPGDQAQGKDGYADLFLTMALGNPAPKRPDRFWNDPQSVMVKLAREVFGRPDAWDAGLAADSQRNPLPRLYLPVLRRDLPDGGYLAWIEKTPEAEKAMGHDGANWSLAGPSAGPSGMRWGYDWEALPESENTISPGAPK